MNSLLLIGNVAKVGNLGMAFIVVCGVLAIVLAFVLFRKDESKHIKQQEMLKGAGILRENGCVILPRMMECYATSNWMELERLVRDELSKLSHPEHLQREFNKVFDHIVIAKCKDPEKRLAFAKHVVDLLNKDSDHKFVLARDAAKPAAVGQVGQVQSALTG